jgi:predicted transcriptional regulator
LFNPALLGSILGGSILGNYRSRLDIIADILHVASQGAKKTRIMYQANLSHKVLTVYLAEIVKASLVRFERKDRCYVLTSKGRQFLERYKEYSRRNRHVEKQLNDINGKKEVLEKLCSRARS